MTQEPIECIVKTPYNFATMTVSSIAFYELYKEITEGSLAKSIFKDSSFFKYYFYYRVILGLGQFPIHTMYNGIRYSNTVSEILSGVPTLKKVKGKEFIQRIKICDVGLLVSGSACAYGIYLLSGYEKLSSFRNLEIATLAIWGSVFLARMATRLLGNYESFWYLFKETKNQ
jgi:hypothetical protein